MTMRRSQGEGDPTCVSRWRWPITRVVSARLTAVSCTKVKMAMSTLEAFQTVRREPPAGGYPYREKYVAFVDMLGFRYLVETADASAEMREALAKIVGVFRSTIGSHEQLGSRVTHFSDCLIVSADRSEQGLWALLQGCTWLALNLIQYPVLLRGGIAVGHITHEPDVVFGMGVNRAYAFEKSGSPPRIGLGHEVVSDIERSALLSGAGFLTQDHQTGEPMLHFLREIEGYDAIRRTGGIVWDRTAGGIAEKIRVNVEYAGQPAEVRAKYIWLKEYWNRAVARMSILPQV